MLKSFLELQQKELDSLGEMRSQLRNVLQQEEHRCNQLTQIREALLDNAGPSHPLCWQNKHGMHQQISRLIAHQHQQVAVAKSELSQHESTLIRQFGKVKGLESVIAGQEAAVKTKLQRAEQKHLDELSVQMFLRRHQR